MTRLTLSRDIHCPVDEVFAYHTDLERAPQHWWNVIACTRRDDGGYAWRYRMYGVEFSGTARVRDIVTNERFVFVAEGGLHGTVSCRYTAVSARRTRVDVDVDYEVPMGVLGRAVDRVLVEHRNAQDGERAMTRLAERLEAEAIARQELAG
jgi:uncharacterized membrane protein